MMPGCSLCTWYLSTHTCQLFSNIYQHFHRSIMYSNYNIATGHYNAKVRQGRGGAKIKAVTWVWQMPGGYVVCWSLISDQSR